MATTARASRSTRKSRISSEAQSTRSWSATSSRRRRSTTLRRRRRSSSDASSLRLAIAEANLDRGGRGSASAAFGRRALSFNRRRQLFLIMFGAPAVIYVLAVAVWPLAQGFSYSFYDYSLLRPAARSFVGLENYRALFANDAAR